MLRLFVEIYVFVMSVLVCSIATRGCIIML